MLVNELTENIKSMSENIESSCDENTQKQIKKRRSISSENKKLNLINDSSISDFKLEEKPTSMWSRFKTRMSNFKNNLKYNTFTLNSFLDFFSYMVIKVFDKVYYPKDDLDKFSTDLYFTIFMSYRSEFPFIMNPKNNKKFSSDCGWGCMIRTAQMMLARGVNIIKSTERKDDNFLDKTSDHKKLEICIETILMFMDTYLPSNNIYSEKEDKSKYIFPPFSIQNICIYGQLINVYPGDWFSDVKMINIFSQLNNKYQPVKNLSILHFQDGVIYGSKIKELTDTNSEFKILIFVSMRHGLDKLSVEYVNSIKDFYDLPFNLGIIGGKTNNAHYFIGTAGDNLLYLDPHLNQTTIKSLEELYKDPSSYIKKQIYETNVKNMSPAFTVGFFISNLKEYETLLKAIEVFCQSEFPIFSYNQKENLTVRNEMNDGLDQDENDF